MDTDATTTSANENRANLAVEDEDEDEDAGLEEIHINIPAGVVDMRSVLPPRTRGDDVKMSDFKPFVVTVASTTTAPNTKFTYTHSLAAAPQVAVNTTTSSSTNTRAPAAALGSPPAPRAVPAPPSQREVRDAMLRRLEEEEEREEAAREERLAAQRRAKLASRPRWSGLRLPTATPPSPPPARATIVAVPADAAMVVEPVCAAPSARPVVAPAPVSAPAARHTVARAPTPAPTASAPAARPVVARAPASVPTTRHVKALAPSAQPVEALAPTPAQAKQEKEERMRGALLARRTALGAILDAGLLPPPGGEPELARRHAELQEEIDGGMLPPLPARVPEDKEKGEEKEKKSGKGPEEEREDNKKETEMREIPSPLLPIGTSPPEVPRMRATAPSPQAEETAVQTGMGAEVLGIQADNVASGPVFVGAPVRDVDVEMESEEDAQVERPRNGAQATASEVQELDIMEQDDGAWPASTYAVYQPAPPAYMDRHTFSAAPFSTFGGAHTMPMAPPIDNDPTSDGMDTREHASYLYDMQPELPCRVLARDTYTCAPSVPPYGAQDVVMQDADTAVQVEGALSMDDAAVAAAMAADPELMQLLDDEVRAQMEEIAAWAAADVGAEGGWTGVVDEGEQGRAGEGPGVAPSDSQRHAPTPSAVPVTVPTLDADDDSDVEEEQVPRPRPRVSSRCSAACFSR